MNNMFGFAWYVVLVVAWCLPAVVVSVALVGAVVAGALGRRWHPAAVAASLEHRAEEPLVLSGS